MMSDHIYMVPVAMTQDEIDTINVLSKHTGLLMSEVIQQAIKTYCEVDGWMND